MIVVVGSSTRAKCEPETEHRGSGQDQMKKAPNGLIYTILAGETPIIALEATGREAGELCKEKWFRDELSTLKSKGEPLYGMGVQLRARPAIENELIRYQDMSDRTEAFDDILFVYLVDIDGT
jgi:hypothetical protein